MDKIKTVGYKIVFSTELNQEEIEEKFDDFLREVDAKKQIAQVVEMSEKEVFDEIVFFVPKE